MRNLRRPEQRKNRVLRPCIPGEICGIKRPWQNFHYDAIGDENFAMVSSVWQKNNKN